MSGGTAQRHGSSFLSRMKNVILHPKNEWERIRQEQSSAGIARRYLSAIAFIPPFTAIAERFIFGRGAVGSQPISVVLATNIFWYFVIIVNMVVTASVLTLVTGKGKTGWIDQRGFKLAVYSFTPLFLVSLVAVISRLNWTLYAAIAYSLYILYLGIQAMIGVDRNKAAWYTAVSFCASALIVGTMDTFEYMLESFVVSRLQS